MGDLNFGGTKGTIYFCPPRLLHHAESATTISARLLFFGVMAAALYCMILHSRGDMMGCTGGGALSH